MSSVNSIIFISEVEMQFEFERILQKFGFAEDASIQCAEIFTSSSVDGVYTHGVNRFPKFIEMVKNGFINPSAIPSLKHVSGCMEQWDGNLGPGPLNAIRITERAKQISREYGIGCVGLSNTNHWMRGGTYGWHAARSGFIFIGFTNTIANMPAWGAINNKLGNNPLVMAIPYRDEAIVLDMAMSQYSFGTLELKKMKDEKLTVPGGFDKNGNLSQDPSAILDSNRALPAGFWKGAGLSLLLDLLATILSGGNSTRQISSQDVEYGLSQVFIVIDKSKLGDPSAISLIIENIISDYHQSIPENEKNKIVYPGERVLETRRKNLANGIPVILDVWEKIMKI